MFKTPLLIQLLLLSSIVAGVPAVAAETLAANEKDAIRATLLESKEKNRGVAVQAGGASIAMVVTALDERYAIGRSQQSARIVVRIDRIDAVSGAF